MRSYETARGLFSIISFFAWVTIIGGGFLAVFGGAAAAERTFGNQEAAMLLGAMPGVAILLLGIFTLAMAQVGRAGVDTAEYAQQALQVARDHMDISKQSLRQGAELRASFEALRPLASAPSTASFATLGEAGKPSAPPASSPAPNAASLPGATRSAPDLGPAAPAVPLLPVDQMPAASFASLRTPTKSTPS